MTQGRFARTFDLPAGECVWAIAVADQGKVALEGQWVLGDEVASGCEFTGLGTCPEGEPLCAPRAGRYLLEFEELPTGVALAVGLWRRRRPGSAPPPEPALPP